MISSKARLVVLAGLGILAVAGAFFVARNLSGSAAALDDLSLADCLLIAAGGLLAMLAAASYGAIWTAILGRLLGTRRVALRAALRAFVYSWLGRYIPGTLPYHASRVLMAERLRTEKRVIAASIGYETILLISSAALVGVVGLFISLGSEMGSGSVYLFAAVPLLPLPFVLQPSVLRPLSTRALKIVGRQPLGEEFFLAGSTNLRFFALYCCGHVINGLGFFVVIEAVAPGSGVSPALAVAVVNLAGVLGIMAFVAPGGLGVRDAITIAFLGQSMSTETALAVAAVWRGVTILSDVTFVFLFAAADFTVTRLSHGRSVVGSVPAADSLDCDSATPRAA